MYLKCSKCGTKIEFSEEATASPLARVACPKCHTRYRLKAKTGATGRVPATPPSGAVSQAPPPPPAPMPSATPTSGPIRLTPTQNPVSEDQPTSRLEGAARTPTSPSRPGPPTTPRTGTFEPPPPGFRPGDLLAHRYRIVRFLAQGGMGEVYEAEDTELLEHVALKTISAQAGADEAAKDRFKREIFLARKVTHPNVCRIFDLGQHRSEDGRPDVTFLTMELLKGETLAGRLRRTGRLATTEALPIASQIAWALQAAHKVQVVHRDLKSENIYLVEDNGKLRAVVTDFGIARGGREDRFAALVTGTDIVGTPAYMAPEQVESLPVTAAADIYAFGVVLYEMVTGQLPFEGDNPITVAAKRLQERPRPPHTHVPDLDARWERTILRCLERTPEKRFQSAAEVIDALTPAKAGSRRDRPAPAPAAARLPGATGATAAALPRGSARRRGAFENPKVRLLAVLALVLIAVLAFQILRRGEDEGAGVLAPRRSVAVLGLENPQGEGERAWLSTALAEMLATELERGEVLRAIPGDRVAQMRREIGLGDTQDLSTERLRQVHSILGCDFVVAGQFVATSAQLRIDLRLADAAVGRTLSSLSQQGTEDDLFELVRRLGDDLRAKLDVEGAGGDDPLAGLPKDRKAAKLYSEGLESLRRSQAEAARDAFREAASIEPGNALVQSALSSAWGALGYGSRAAEAAERAFELSSTLSREDRLEIEGRYREIQGNWPAAIHVYQTLFNHFPDNLEYGLRLANSLISARDPSAALETVSRLRQLPAPASQDPRIDLAESAAASLLGDHQLQLAAARRGTESSHAVGASLLEAQGLLAQSRAWRFLGSPEKAGSAARQAYELYEGFGHGPGAAEALTEEGNALFEGSEIDRATADYQQAIELYREAGAQGQAAAALSNLALALKESGNLDRALELLEEVETAFETTENREGVANAANNRAAILLLRDELGTAEELFRRAGTLWQEAQDRRRTAIALHNLAVVLRLEGRLDESLEDHENALQIRREIGDKPGEVYSLSNLAGALADRGELAKADELLTKAVSLADSLGLPRHRAQCRFELAELRLLQGQLDTAMELHTEAKTLREESKDFLEVADSELAIARLKLERGESAAAEIDARTAISHLHPGRRKGDEAKATAVLALALLDQNLVSEARLHVDQALSLGAGSRQLGVRFWALYADAAVSAAEGSSAKAVKAAEALAQEMTEAGVFTLALQARLLGAQLAYARRQPGAVDRLTSVQDAAATKGYAHLSAKAAATLH